MATPPFPSVGVPVLAKLLNISERRVQQLAKQGIIARSRAGEYDLCRSLHGYTAYLQSLITAPDASNESAALQRERVRLVKAQADRAECLYRVESGQWVSLTAVEAVLQEVGAVFTGSLEALPGRLAFELVGLEDPAVVKARLLAACRGCREHTGARLIELGKTFLSHHCTGAAGESPLDTDPGSVGGCSSDFTAGEC